MILCMLMRKPATFSKFISLEVQNNPRHLLNNNKDSQLQVTSLPYQHAWKIWIQNLTTRQDAGFFSQKTDEIRYV